MDPSTIRPPEGPRTGRGTLFVVATPIGNLEDITLRALRILREVALVAAEDTRRTGNLLRHYGISTPLISLHEHNERRRQTQLIQRLRAGDSIALVSDAGTPGISDPGALLVRAAREAGLRVDPIPGPSAVTAVLSASGLTFDRFAFAGFPPTRSKDRKSWLDWVRSLADVPVVAFEAPHRVHRTLTELRSLLVDRPIIVARELTKTHEEWRFSDAQASEGHETILDRGEIVIIISQKTNFDVQSPSEDEDICALFGQLSQNGAAASRRELVSAVADRLNLPAKAVYRALERAKTKPA